MVSFFLIIVLPYRIIWVLSRPFLLPFNRLPFPVPILYALCRSLRRRKQRTRLSSYFSCLHLSLPSSPLWTTLCRIIQLLLQLLETRPLTMMSSQSSVKFSQNSFNPSSRNSRHCYYVLINVYFTNNILYILQYTILHCNILWATKCSQFIRICFSN